MKTVLVADNDRGYYNDMLPGELMFLLYDPDMILVGVVDETDEGAVPAALMILCGGKDKTAILEWLFVKEEYRGRGIGEDLMMQAFALAKETKTGILRAKMRLTKDMPDKGKKDRDGYASNLYGQREWLELFGFSVDEMQDNEWMFFIEDMIDANKELFARDNSRVNSFSKLAKSVQAEYIKKIIDAYGEELADKIDMDISCAITDKDFVSAVLLVARVDVTYTPVLFYSKNGKPDYLIDLISYAAKSAIEKSDEVAMLHMVWKDYKKMTALNSVLNGLPPVDTILMSAYDDAPSRLMERYEAEQEEIKRVNKLKEQIPTKFQVVDVEYLSGVIIDDMQ